MSIFELKDVKTTPDPFHTYDQSLKDAFMPLVIDNGEFSYINKNENDLFCVHA